MDLFDPKPELQKRDGQQHPDSVEIFQPGSEANMLLASPFKFRKHGQCGMELPSADRTRRTSPTTSASSARCTPSTTTTPRR